MKRYVARLNVGNPDAFTEEMEQHTQELVSRYGMVYTYLPLLSSSKIYIQGKSEQFQFSLLNEFLRDEKIQNLRLEGNLSQDADILNLTYSGFIIKDGAVWLGDQRFTKS